MIKFIRKIVLILTVTFVVQQNCYANNKDVDTIFYFNHENLMTNNITIPFKCLKFNKYKISNNMTHQLSDTLYWDKDMKLRTTFQIDTNEILEVYFKIYIDSSLVNKIIGLRIPDNCHKAFWNYQEIFSHIKVNKNHSSKLKFTDLNVYPICIKDTGVHNVFMQFKYKYNTPLIFIFWNKISVFRTYDDFFADYRENEGGFKAIVLDKGFRYFLISVFCVCLLFYLIVYRKKSFLWFSVFLFCITLISFVNIEIGAIFNDRIYNALFSFFCFILLLSLSLFIFYTFFEKIPKRVYYYFSIMGILTVLPVLFYPIVKGGKFPMINYLISILFFLCLFILLIEILIKIIYAIKIRKKRIKILAFGVLCPCFILIFGLFTPSPIRAILFSIAPFSLPVSFLITLIYLIKDTYTENFLKQKEVLILTQTNEKMLAEQNIVLEIKVNQRTEELREANEELNQQNHEIKAQRDEIEAQRDLVTQQKNQIEHIYNEISNSIRYAERIQNAVLPQKNIIESSCSEYFIFFKPRDIVSGDFYWFTKRENWLLIAVADCTGHGVPGAFMSMLGISFLNEIVSQKEIIESSKVLDELRGYVIKSLQQKGIEGEQKDGMDISFLAINTEKNILQYSGANNPLYIIPNQNRNELIEIKADKMPIGIYEMMNPFTNHEIQINKGDSFYIFSDGFIDQFGGENRKKFLSKRFKQTLIQLSDLTMIEQNKQLSLIFEEWQGNTEQIDDVTVLGIRI